VSEHVLDGVPHGLGVYLGRGGVTPARARELARARVRHVVLCAEAVSGWLAAPSQLAEWGRVVRGEGMVPHVYAFPGLSRAREPRRVAAWLVGSLRLAGGVCPVPDLEAPYQRRPALLVALLDALAELATPGELEAVLVTTLGLPSDPGTSWPWPELAAWVARTRARTGRPVGSIGWQCYERAGIRPRVRAGLDELAGTWGRARVVPHLAGYERRTATLEGRDGPARLRADLERACLDAAGACDVPGVWIWSAASLERAEVAILRAWAERHGW
jgi:hypothetical protein